VSEKGRGRRVQGRRRGVNRFIAVFQSRNYCSGFPSSDIRLNPARACVRIRTCMRMRRLSYLAECFHSLFIYYSPLHSLRRPDHSPLKSRKEKQHTKTKSLTVDWIASGGGEPEDINRPRDRMETTACPDCRARVYPRRPIISAIEKPISATIYLGRQV